MTRLFQIQETVQEVAEAITAALGIETELTDDLLTIVAGTGRYRKKIGSKEENGDLDSGYLYAEALKTGKTYIIEEVNSYEMYGPKEDELAEVCCPVILDGKVIGLMGLVAFNESQRDRLLSQKESMLQFIKSMAGLLASKVAENEIAMQMNAVLQSTHDGIMSVCQQGRITSANRMAEVLLKRDRNAMIGTSLYELWPDLPLKEALEKREKYLDNEVIMVDQEKNINRFLTSISPLQDIPSGAVVSFRDMAEVRKMAAKLTEMGSESSFAELRGSSQSMVDLREKGRKIAAYHSTVLITGESGTGKGLLARAIHSASPVSQGPMVNINCGAIPDTLLEAELFGYEGGSFTGANKAGKAGRFELANDGTLFLDEIGDLPLHLQVKLLHVLQNKEVQRVGGIYPIPINVRVIAATNRDLEKMIREKLFREDLFFRLNVIPLHILPLRERKEDIQILLEEAVEKYCSLNHKDILKFEKNALELLHEYDWPGNIRELENVVEYSVTMETGNMITLDNLPVRILQWRNMKGNIRPLKHHSQEKEKEIIEECLQQTGHSLEGKRKAAELLEISESTLYRRIRELGITKPKRKSITENFVKLKDDR